MPFLKRGVHNKKNTVSTDESLNIANTGSKNNLSLVSSSNMEQTDHTTTTDDDDTIAQSGNSQRDMTKVPTNAIKSTNEISNVTQTTEVDATKTPTKQKEGTTTTTTPGNTFIVSIAEQLRLAQEQITLEKSGKRKLFHSLVKVANELRKCKEEQQQQNSSINTTNNKQWYDGGLWRAPQVLPGIKDHNLQTSSSQPSRLLREAISLSDLFFHLVIVTAFTRVGVAISLMGYVDYKSFLYFAIFWNIWSKEASYTTRFDTTDLSAQMENLVTCFAVLFGSLSVQADLYSIDGTRIMIMASFVAILHCALHIRVAISNWRGQVVSPALLTTQSERTITNPLSQHVLHYAVFNIIFTALEATTWIVGIVLYPYDWPYRWCIVTAGIILGLRVPRAFLANDFHAACSQRGVLFILLLGFLLQSIVVVASEFFEYQTPTIYHYSFIGAACLLLFCIKLLYVTDNADSTIVEDHALLVNRFAAFFFNVGQFTLLLSTTIMGSGLNLLTHEYLSASAALPGPAKSLVTGGFAAVLLSTFFIKSMHLKRVPTDPRNQALFIGAYVVQGVVLLIVVGIATAMSFGVTFGLLQYLMQTDIQLLFSLSGAALFVVVMSWLDEGLELMLYRSAADSREFRIHPFGLWWWCLKPDLTSSEMDAMVAVQQHGSNRNMSSTRLSVLSPLLGSSLADLKEFRGSMYQSVSSSEMDFA